MIASLRLEKNKHSCVAVVTVVRQKEQQTVRFSDY